MTRKSKRKASEMSYWNYVSDHYQEQAEANPDLIGELDRFISLPLLSEIDEKHLEEYYRLLGRGLLNKLSLTQRRIWKMRFIKWFEEWEIAAKLKITVSAVRTHLSRAGFKIRAEIEKKCRKASCLEGNYFLNGFKKGITEVGSTDTDQDMTDRLEHSREEIEEFCKRHPELRGGM